MSLKDTRFWVFWEKYGQHITAVSILICLIISINLLVDYNQLQKDISNNCGWGGEDYECYCKKSEALAIKNILDTENYEYYKDLETGEVLEHKQGVYNEGWEASNVSLVG